MRHVDLNLLRLLDSLMTERSVTRTGERLGITQPAVSHGLRRLRDMIGDPLFVRGPAGLEPTERMRQIEPKLRDGLAMIRDAMTEPSFDPRTDERRFTIAAVSYVCAMLVPLLAERIEAIAPNVELRILMLPEDLSEPITSRKIDLAIGSFEQLPPRLDSELLFEDHSVWVVNSSHPLAGSRPSLDQLMGLRRVVVNAAADMEGIRGRIVSGGVKRRIFVDLGEHFGPGNSPLPIGTVTVYDVRTALSIVARTQMAAVVPRRLAEAALRFSNLAILEPPVTPQPLGITMIWHRELGREPSIAWLRGIIAEVAHTLGALEPN